MTHDEPPDNKPNAADNAPGSSEVPAGGFQLPASEVKEEESGNGSTARYIAAGIVGLALVGGGVLIGTHSGSGTHPSQDNGVSQTTGGTERQAPIGTPAETSAASTPTPEVKTSSTESEARFATYLDTLNPQQKAMRESLTPESLAAMDTGKLTEAFTIKISEVAGADGVVDPALYAEAFTARNEAILTFGCSSVEYAKWGGISNFATQEMAATVNTYFTPETTALFGYSGDSRSVARTLTICSTIDHLNQGSSSLNLEPYHLRSTVDEASVKAVSPVEFSFDMTSTDNVDIDLIRSRVGLDIAPTNEITKWDISNLRVATDGRVSASFSSQIISN